MIKSYAGINEILNNLKAKAKIGKTADGFTSEL